MIELRFPKSTDKEKALDYIQEFKEYKSNINGTGGLDKKDYDLWLKDSIDWHNNINVPEPYVPGTTYLVYNGDDILVGMVNIRHELNTYLIESGSGHIGYSVRPTQRRKGYAKEILRLALEILYKNHNVEIALVGCYKDNIGSKKTIEANGGKLDREILEDDGRTTLAYLIDIKGN